MGAGWKAAMAVWIQGPLLPMEHIIGSQCVELAWRGVLEVDSKDMFSFV